jgi:UDP-N-acetylmuramoylalanine--D-glutamate ligase
VLNLAPNHLDRHGTMEAYQQAKEHILAYQTPGDTAILNWDDAIVRGMASRSCGQQVFYSVEQTLPEGVYRQGTAMVLATAGQQTVLCQQADLPLHGAHNFGNAAAAAAAAVVMGVPPRTIVHGMQRFRGLPHRLELVATKGGVEYYNDSKATTPVSTIRAIQAFERPVILLAGGYDKGTPFEELGQIIQTQTKAAFLYGKTAPKLAQAIAQAGQTVSTLSAAHVAQVPNLDAALQQAVALAKPGDVVLLSPACASYDQFAHYEARGEHFRQLVQALP